MRLAAVAVCVLVSAGLTWLSWPADRTERPSAGPILLLPDAKEPFRLRLDVVVDGQPPTAAWSVVLGGGGIRGGQVIGKTSADGMAVVERPVKVADLMATICLALGLDPRKQNPSNVDRPIRLADPSGQAVKEVLS